MAKTFEEALIARLDDPLSTEEVQQFNIEKTDGDKRLVFGWANIAITADGEQVVDHQNDVIDPEDLEEAAYEYVLEFRDTGEEHIPSMRKKGSLVESVVFTKEKMKAMGIPEGIVPEGWWVGFKIHDDTAWEKVKDGTYKMFSIEGKAMRVEMTDEIEKANPYHDEKGRFTTKNGGGAGGTVRPYNKDEQAAMTSQEEAANYLMNEGISYMEASKMFNDGTATAKAKEIIDAKYKELQERYDGATEGQKTLMKMTPEEVSAFIDESFQGDIPRNLNTGSKTQSVIHKLGMHEKPEVVSREEFEQIASQSPSGKIYRGVKENPNLGVSAQDIIDLTVSGDQTFIGYGIHSDGIYFSTNTRTAEGYAGRTGAAMEACISPKARVVDGRELVQESNDPSRYTINDPGIYALYKGYNVLKLSELGEDYYIALDRSALVFPEDYTMNKAHKEINGEELGKVFNEFATQKLKGAKKKKVAKSFQEALIEKFNPFHDSKGRFSNKHGFASYSANPKTTAGRMAIERSAAGGHGKTMNVHRESQGENIDQNANWLKGGPGAKALAAQGQLASQQPKQPAQPAPKVFAPAKDVQEATDYAKNELGFKNVNFGRMDLETVNHINEELTNVFKEYPELKGAVENLGQSKSKNSYASVTAWADGKMELEFGALMRNGLDLVAQKYQNDVAVGFHPKGTDYRANIWHEMGHVAAHVAVKKQLGTKPDEKFTNAFKARDYFNALKGDTYEKDIVKTAAKNMKTSMKALKAGISRYAEQKPAETFAEAFAEYHTSKNPRPECIAIMEAAGLAKKGA